MGILNKLIGGGATAPIDAIGNVIGTVFEGKNAKLSHEEVMEALKQNPAKWQTEITKIEAQHRTIFVAGWRPFIGWVCGLGLANTFLINPWLQWAFPGHPVPILPNDVMTQLVMGLLGLGALRTVEKINGSSK